jgi:hypothetical protein
MSKPTPKADSIRVELLLRKARAGRQLTVGERREKFDANTKWLDELQADQLKEAKANGTRVTRSNRGWTRKDLYEDLHGLSR